MGADVLYWSRSERPEMPARFAPWDELLQRADILSLQNGITTIRNGDIRNDLAAIAKQVDFEWLRRAVVKIDELVEFQRRNIQKGIALDALVAALRPA